MDVIIPTALSTASFSRSTVATYYNSTGLVSTAAINVIRANYDPSNLSAAASALLESASTNNAYSQNFMMAGYVLQLNKGTTADYNCITAPDGRYFGDKVVEDTTNSTHLFYVGDVSTAGNPGSYSIYVKAGERTVFDLVSINFSESWRFDLTAGTVSGTGTNSSAIIKNVSGGWYRCSISGLSLTVQFMLVNGSGNTSYTGDGKSGIYVWGQQGEQQSFVSSYIYTPPTFTSRSSSATYINSSGLIATASTNVARQSYNPSNLTLTPQLLIEPAATNICKQSQQFNSTWTTTTTLAATQADPAGGTTACNSTDNSAAVTQVLSQAITVTNDSEGYVFSVYIKKTTTATTFPGIEIKFSGGTAKDTSITFNTNTGTFVANAASTNPNAYARVDSNLNFWRVSIGLYNNTTGNTTLTANIYPAVNTDASGTWAVATTGTITIWGAQVETTNLGLGLFGVKNLTRTSYIATTTTSVTRSADVFTWAAFTRAADVAGVGMLFTNIPETDFPAWNSGTTYGIDVSGSNSVVYNHVKYASLQASNTNHQPDTSPTWWSVIGATNAYAMIDTQVGTQTIATVGTDIVCDIKIGPVSSLSFLNMVADSVSITISSGGIVQYTTTLDLTGGSTGVPITDYTLTGIPTYSDGVVRLDIAAASPKAAACGNFVIGTSYYLGSTETSPTVGIVDYSIKTVDAFGNPTLTKRGYAKRMGGKTFVDNAQVDVVARLMAQVRATPCVWNANTNMTNLISNTKTSLIVYGYYKDWEIECASPSKSYMTYTIEGLI